MYSRRGRKKVSDKSFIPILQKACTKMNIEIKDEDLYKLFILMVCYVSNNLYNNSETYYRFPHFKVFRAKSKNNLLQIDIVKDKEVLNAESILRFYLSEGLERRKINELMTDFVDNLIEYSVTEEENGSDVINKLKSRKNKREM